MLFYGANEAITIKDPSMTRLCKTIVTLILTFSYFSSVNAGEYLANVSWPEANKLIETQTVIIPFAAGAKEHGPHLPMSTDQIVLEYLLAQAKVNSNVIIAPAILHGWFPAFRQYPGTEVSDPTIFQDYVRSVAESLVRSGAKRIVFINMGITKATGLPIAIVARDIRVDHKIPTLVISWDDLETAEAEPLLKQERGGHADEGETSIILHLRPDLVNMSKAVKDYGREKKAQIGYAPGKFDRTADVGVYGDPTLAEANKGRKILAIMVKNWLLALEQFEGNNQ
ncbi:MAG: creatininase family protein [Kangiellaceae bacterium]|nr:creatininase family protein [Kangiellaceae bacterium]